MAKRKKKDTEQFQRFKEAVKEFDADQSGQTLDRAMEKLVPISSLGKKPSKSE